MRRKELGHIIIEKSQARCAQAKRIRRKVELAAHDTRFELRGPITSIAESIENAFQIRQEKNVDAAIRRNLLAESQISGIATKIPLFEEFQRAFAFMKDISARRETVNCMNYQIEIVKEWPRSTHKIAGDIAGHPIKQSAKLSKADRVAGEFAGGAAALDNILESLGRKLVVREWLKRD